MVFYRFQSKEYNITKESQSFGWCYDSLEEAMEEDISMCQKSYAQAVYETLEELKKVVGENSDIYKTVLKKSWWNLVENHNMPHHAAQMGVSCFADPEDLIRYFNERLGFCPDSEKDNYYILKFEGAYLEEGCDGEDVAEFEREIERISIDDFEKMFGQEA